MARSEQHAQQVIVLIQGNGVDPALARIGERLQVGFFNDAFGGGHDQVTVFGKFGHRHHGGHALLLFQLEQVDDRLALGGASALGQFIHFQPMHPPLVGEVQDVVVRGGDEQVLDEIFFLGAHRGYALAAPALPAVHRHGDALDVAGMGNGHHHVLFGDQVFEFQVGSVPHDAGAALIAEAILDLEQLVPQDGHEQFRFLQNLLVIGDVFNQLLVFLLQFLPFQGDETLELHFEDGLGLNFGEFEAGHKAGQGFFAGLGSADEGDHLVNVVDGDAEALQDMGAGFGLAQVEEGAFADHVAPVIDKVGEQFAQGKVLGPVVDQGQQDDAEGGLHLGVLVQLVENHLPVFAALQLDDDAHAFAVRLVA